MMNKEKVVKKLLVDKCFYWIKIKNRAKFCPAMWVKERDLFKCTFGGYIDLSRIELVDTERLVYTIRDAKIIDEKYLV